MAIRTRPCEHGIRARKPIVALVGALRSMGGLVVAAGFSGHGFAIAPAIGRALADQLVGKPVPELDGLRPDRPVSKSAAVK